MKSPPKPAPTYQIDDDMMHQDYIRHLSIGFEYLDAEGINELADRSLNTISDVLSHLEHDIEGGIRDKIIRNQEISYADNSVDLFHEQFSNIGETTTVRIGETINFAESSKLFPKYLTFLACIYNNHSGSDLVWNHLLKLFTKNRYEAMQRLLKCKKSLSRGAGSTLARFILKRCKGKTGKKNYPSDLESTFKRTFDLKRDYTIHHLNVHILHLDKVKTDIDKLRVYLSWRERFNMEPKKITAENAILFLALLYSHQNPKANHVAIDTVDRVMKECGVDLSESNDIETSVGNMITHLRINALKHFRNLVFILGDKSGWKLTKAKNVKIEFASDAPSPLLCPLFKERLGPN